MGRQSGYITANASIASQDVNFCLIPEMPFDLEGENGFYKHLMDRILRKNHAVVVVAEGVGDRLCALEERDVSGNRKFGDVGVMLRDGIAKYFKDRKVPVSLKYIDPSYIIRSSSAIPSDSIFCNQLAQNAVHAGIAGKTGMLVGIWNNCFTHVPIDIRSNTILDRKHVLAQRSRTTGQQPLVRANRAPPDAFATQNAKRALCGSKSPVQINRQTNYDVHHMRLLVMSRHSRLKPRGGFGC